MIKHLITYGVLFTSFCTWAQTIDRTLLSNGGEPMENSQIRLNFSIGEPIVGLVGTGENTIDQGFWSGYIFLDAPSENDTNDDLILFPVPVVDILHIVPGENEVIGLRVFSLNGQQVMNRILTDNGPEIQVNMTQLSNATYVARIFVRGENRARTFKIIKR